MTVELPDDRDVYTTSLKVRFYELDPYDHVNHTNYFSYFETAPNRVFDPHGDGVWTFSRRMASSWWWWR